MAGRPVAIFERVASRRKQTSTESTAGVMMRGERNLGLQLHMLVDETHLPVSSLPQYVDILVALNKDVKSSSL